MWRSWTANCSCFVFTFFPFFVMPQEKETNFLKIVIIFIGWVHYLCTMNSAHETRKVSQVFPLDQGKKKLILYTPTVSPNASSRKQEQIGEHAASFIILFLNMKEVFWSIYLDMNALEGPARNSLSGRATDFNKDLLSEKKIKLHHVCTLGKWKYCLGIPVAKKKAC